jgi:hypothetical protein
MLFLHALKAFVETLITIKRFNRNITLFDVQCHSNVALSHNAF